LLNAWHISFIKFPFYSGYENTLKDKASIDHVYWS
jgi:hypothetical protein